MGLDRLRIPGIDPKFLENARDALENVDAMGMDIGDIKDAVAETNTLLTAQNVILARIADVLDALWIKQVLAADHR